MMILIGRLEMDNFSGPHKSITHRYHLPTEFLSIPDSPYLANDLSTEVWLESIELNCFNCLIDCILNT